MIKFGLVGCGRIAHRHSELLASGTIAGAALSAVCDIDEAKARELGERCGVPYFTDMHDMMTSVALDAVSVLTESGRHAAHAIALAQYGKTIVVEKPMALTLADADAMIAACAESGSRLFVVKQNRFNLPIVKTREALESGRLGKLVLGTVRVRWCRTQAYYDQAPWRGTWALDGGVLTNQASHHIDVLQWMMGEPVSVFGMSTTALADIEAEDTAVVVLRFRNGALGVIEATTAARPVDLEGSLSLLGEKGTIEVSGFALNEMKTWNLSDPESSDDDLDAMSSNPPDVYGFGHRSFYEHVVSAVETGRPALVDGLEGRRSLELITAIYESIETHREVQLRFSPKECRLGLT